VELPFPDPETIEETSATEPPEEVPLSNVDDEIPDCPSVELSVEVIMPGGAPRVLDDGVGFTLDRIGPKPLRPRELDPVKFDGGPTGPGPLED